MSARKATLCRLDELVDGGARRFDADGHRLAVIRLGDTVHAIGDRCTHADISLSEGDVHVAERTIECWKHGSCFSLVTGVPDTLPATKPTPVYPTAVVDGDVVVDLP